MNDRQWVCLTLMIALTVPANTMTFTEAVLFALAFLVGSNWREEWKRANAAETTTQERP